VPVTLVSSRDQVLPGEDSDAAEVLEEVFQSRGGKITERGRAATVTRTEKGVVVELTDGRTVEGSHALMTVGTVPNTAGLNLERCGVAVTPAGHIVVDRVSRTSVPGIYAAGDVTGVFQLASVAAMQGRIAMWHALGEAVTPIKLKTVAANVFTHPEIATVGVQEKTLPEGADVEVVRLPLATNARAKMSDLRDGFVKLFTRRSTGVVVGGVVVAPGASELILPIALAVTKGLTAADLAQTFSIYPSLSGSITEAGRRLMGVDDLS
jgi:NAD(P)H dehydrogenase (quinone)